MQSMTFSKKVTDLRELLAAVETSYKGGIALMSSFGAEDMVLIHNISQLGLDIPILTLDTGRIFQETHDLIARTESVFGISTSISFPDRNEVQLLVSTKGPNSFYESVENRKECCNIRKVKPLKQSLQRYQAWISGIRSDHTQKRTMSKQIEDDPLNPGKTKINPLLNWSYDDVWGYIHEFNVTYNVLHDRGFKSIGCIPCTRSVALNEVERAGRWWWETGSKECGLHLQSGEY